MENDNEKHSSNFAEAKHEHDKITMVTAYDYTTAKIMDESGVNTILVGDSLGMVMLGYEDTLSVTMEDMIHHTAAVPEVQKMHLLLQICRLCPIRLPSMMQW